MENRQIEFLKTIAEDFLSVFKNKDGQVKYLTSSDYSELYDEDDEKRFECRSGASKVVLIPRDTNIPYVVKIPFCGSYHKSLFVQRDNRGWDYCRTEVDIYEQAKKEHIEYLFAETSFLFNCLGYPVYLQERAKTGTSYYPSHQSMEYVNSKKVIQNGICEMSISNFLAATIVDYYGHSAACNFIRFCRKYHLNDFHGGNFAFVPTKQPISMKSTGDFFNDRLKVCVIDYSGFSGRSQSNDSESYCKKFRDRQRSYSSSDSDSSNERSTDLSAISAHAFAVPRDIAIDFDDVIFDDNDPGDFAAVELNKPLRGLRAQLRNVALRFQEIKDKLQVRECVKNPP